MATRPLLSRLEELEQQRLSLEQERQRIDREIAASRLKRPDAGQVERLWGRVLELWDAANEAERVQRIGLLVERVEVKDKEHAFCRLLFSAEKPCSLESRPDLNVGLRSNMGAGGVTGSIYPQRVRATFHAYRGGKNRKKQPRPWQRGACVPPPCPKKIRIEAGTIMGSSP